MRLLKGAWIETPPAETESWEDFERIEKKVKYSIRAPSVAWHKAEVKEKIAKFKDGSESSDFKLKCEEFWKDANDFRRDQLYQKMHPLIFLKQQFPAYEKIQQNWVF